MCTNRHVSRRLAEFRRTSRQKGGFRRSLRRNSPFAAYCGGSHRFAAACGGSHPFAAACGGSRSFAAPCGPIHPSPHLAEFRRTNPCIAEKNSPDRIPRPGRNHVYLACLTSETVRIRLMIRRADGSVIASREAPKTCTAVECCETLAKNVGVFHSLRKTLQTAEASVTIVVAACATALATVTSLPFSPGPSPSASPARRERADPCPRTSVRSRRCQRC